MRVPLPDSMVLPMDLHGHSAIVPGGNDMQYSASKNRLAASSRRSRSFLFVQAADYHHDLEAFKGAVKAQTARYEDGVVRYATVTFYGPSRPGQVDGQAVNLAPSRGYDSPFTRSDWNSGLIYIRKGRRDPAPAAGC